MILALICFVIFSFFGTKIINGNTSNKFYELWGHFGNSYSEIILNILKNPFIIYSQIKEGAFFEINKSLGFINFASPTLGILSNLYGFILYMSNNLKK